MLANSPGEREAERERKKLNFSSKRQLCSCIWRKRETGFRREHWKLTSRNEENIKAATTKECILLELDPLRSYNSFKATRCWTTGQFWRSIEPLEHLQCATHLVLHKLIELFGNGTNFYLQINYIRVAIGTVDITTIHLTNKWYSKMKSA